MQKLAMLTAALFTLGTATLSLSPVLAAQTGTAPQSVQRSGKGHRAAKLAQELGLNATQKAQIKALLQDTRQRNRAIREDNALSPDVKKTRLKELHKETRAKIAAILTPQQRAKWQQIRQEHHRKGAPNHNAS